MGIQSALQQLANRSGASGDLSAKLKFIDGGDFLGIEEALEDLALKRFQDFGAAGVSGVVMRAAVGVGIGDVLDSGEELELIETLDNFV